MCAFQSRAIVDRKMHAVFLQGFLLSGARSHIKNTTCWGGWRRILFSCSCTERQHLGSVPDHLSCIHTQQLASGVHPLCAQIQGENPWRCWVSAAAENLQKTTTTCLQESWLPYFSPYFSGFHSSNEPGAALLLLKSLSTSTTSENWRG